MDTILPCPNIECGNANAKHPALLYGPNPTFCVGCPLCGYRGPNALSSRQAIRLHNLISPQPSAPVQQNHNRKWLIVWPDGNTTILDRAPDSYECRESKSMHALDTILNGVPEGWQLVPKKLTIKMGEAMGYTDDGTHESWERALAASPIFYASPSAQPQPEEAAIDMEKLASAAEGYLEITADHTLRHGRSEALEKRRILVAALQNIRLGKHLSHPPKSAPEPSVAAEALATVVKSHVADLKVMEKVFREHGSFAETADEVHIAIAEIEAALAHPGIVPGWVQMPVAMAAAEYAWQHDDWDWSAVEEGLRSRLEDRDWCLSCELAAAPKGQPAGFTEEDEG